MKTLYVFDFDGTLFRSPYPPKEWKGDPDDWWRIPGSLNPPCIPEKPMGDWWNGDVVKAARDAMADKDGVAVLMTGRRVETFRVRLHKLLAQKGLEFGNIFMKDKMGTVAFKIEMLSKLIKKYGPERVEIWDDRKNHLKRIAEHVRSLGLEAVEHPVVDRPRQIACPVDKLVRLEAMRSDMF